MDTAARVRELVAPLVEAAGAELYDVELDGGVLRITLDRPGGVDIGVIGSVTRAVSRMLDEVDPMPGEYTLEVTSPGLERPLRTPEHFRRAVGDTVSVKTEDRTIAYGDVERVRTVFDWGPAPKPGKAPGAGAPKKPSTSKQSSPEKKAAKP